MEIFDSLEEIRLGSLSLASICWAVLLLVICVIVRRIIMNLFTRAMGKSRLDGSVRSFLRAALGVGLWIVIILIVADSLGIPMASLVAILGVAGLALSLSIQNTLANLFSGMIILGTKPFGAGDYVDVGGTQGTVESVRLFYTTLKALDGRIIHLPNSTVADSKVENYSSNGTRRIDLEISASYDDETEKVKEALLKAAGCTAGVLATPAPFAAVSSYGESSIVYMLLAWTSCEDFLSAKTQLTENIRRSFQDDGVHMSYDHLNIHIIEK